MLACLWFAVDGQGDVTVFRELAVPGLIVSAAARAILEHSPEEVTATLAPPDLWNRQKDTGRSMWELFEAGGVRLSRADPNRIQGWMQVKEALALRDRPDGGRRPRLVIFDTCRELIRCLTSLRHDPHTPGDCAGEPHELTHLPDALRYFLRSRVMPARAERQQAVESPLAVYYARRRGQERKGRFN
jgi:phage terminase large subunit